MKKLLIILSMAVVVATALTGCDNKNSTSEQVRKQQQQANEDKKALRGEFKRSEGKKY